MIGIDREIQHLRDEAEIKEHVGFCFGFYTNVECFLCPTEFECLKLFVTEKADVPKRTINKMKEVQDGTD